MSKIAIDANHPLLDFEKSKLINCSYRNKFSNACKRGIDFNLSLMEFADAVNADKCAYTGVEFVRENGNPHNVSLERINPLVGYVKGNVVAVTYEANTAKAVFDAFIHDESISLEAKLKMMSMVMYRLKKQLKESV